MATATGSNPMKPEAPAPCHADAGARGSGWKRTSVGRGEIIDDLANVRILDRGAIDFDHLRHFGLPEVLLVPARLRADVVRGVTGRAIVLHHIEIRSWLERRGFVRERVGDRSRVCRTKAQACDGGNCEEKRTGHGRSPHAAMMRTVSTTLRK